MPIKACHKVWTNTRCEERLQHRLHSDDDAAIANARLREQMQVATKTRPRTDHHAESTLRDALERRKSSAAHIRTRIAEHRLNRLR